MKLKNYLNFILAMTEKEIKARYKSAILGFLWIFLNPLFQMIIIGFIFQNLIKVDAENYYLFLFSGLLPWNFFSYSLTKTAPSIVYERSLIQKAKFPREAIPLSIVLANFFNLLISVLLLFIALIAFSRNFVFLSPLRLVLIALSLLWLLVTTSGLSLLISALTVKCRDIKFFTEALVILWFYATPIIYPLSSLPDRIKPLLKFNPLVYPFELFRSSVLGNSPPTKEFLLINLIASLIILIVGIKTFRKESDNFSDWL